MPSVKSITPLFGGSYYHIFNRGINGKQIFYKEENYPYFLSLMKRYLIDYVDILAYCLLPNHFHLVIKVKDVIFQKDDILKNEEEIGKIVSNQFRIMFVAYSMAINKQERRTGSLFSRPFKRLEITEQEYLEYVLFYVHYNPEKHGIAGNFTAYKNSSFTALCSKQSTALNRKLVYEIYGSREDFIAFHKGWHFEREEVIIE